MQQAFAVRSGQLVARDPRRPNAAIFAQVGQFYFDEVGQYYSSANMYIQDVDTNPSQALVTFRTRIKRADAVLFVTPEYIRSVPG